LLEKGLIFDLPAIWKKVIGKNNAKLVEPENSIMKKQSKNFFP